MSGAFDPYHKWLGIPPKDQPPNHYRLLAIDLFESDPDVIASAADQRMGHVRSFQTGQRAALSQQILNEIATARVCLLNPEKKAEYDRQLHGELDQDAPQAEPAAASTEALPEPTPVPPLPTLTPPLEEPVAPQLERPLAPLRRRRRVSWQAVAGVLVAAVLFGAVLTALLSNGDSDQIAGNGPQPKTGTKANSAGKPKSKQGIDGSTGGSPKGKSKDQAKPKPPPKQDSTAKPPSGSGKEPAKKVPPEDQGKQPPKKEPQKVPQKVPVPDDDALAAARERLKATLAGATAAELLQAGCADGPTPEERFVLLETARASAAEAGGMATALVAVDEIAVRYEVDELEIKVNTLSTLGEKLTAPAALRSLAKTGFELIDQAIAEKRLDLANQLATLCLSAAFDSEDSDLHKRAVLRVLEVQSLLEGKGKPDSSPTP